MALHNTMRDLSTLVNDQGEGLAAVESNVGAAAEHVARGVEELRVANKYTAAYRKKCCAFALLFLALLATITVPLVLHYVLHKF